MGYRWNQPAYSLSYANRRRLEIARATATKPRLLLLDEPAAGMNPVETHEITELIARLRDEAGYTILVIEHDMHVVEGISDRVDRARPRRQDLRGHVRPRRHRPARRRGVSRRERDDDEMSDDGAPLLELDAVDTYYGQIHILQGLNLHVRAGELVCLLGGNASGKSTTLKTILGIVQPRNGAVRFAGEDVTKRSTSYRIRQGMAIVPENRRLFAPMTVLENLQMGAYLHGGGTKEDFDRVYELFPLLHERRAQLAGTLSGGEQQMVAMGRALMSKPKLLLMDEPSMGLAPILVERIFEIIKQVHESGRRDAHRRAERERLALDRRPRLRPLHRPPRPRRQGRRPPRGRGLAEGVSRPLTSRDPGTVTVRLRQDRRTAYPAADVSYPGLSSVTAPSGLGAARIGCVVAMKELFRTSTAGARGARRSRSRPSSRRGARRRGPSARSSP